MLKFPCARFAEQSKRGCPLHSSVNATLTSWMENWEPVVHRSSPEASEATSLFNASLVRGIHPSLAHLQRQLKPNPRVPVAKAIRSRQQQLTRTKPLLLMSHCLM